MWIILAIGWIAILAAGISLCRMAAYAEEKFRRMSTRARRREDQAA